MAEFTKKVPKNDGQIELVISRGGEREGAGRKKSGLEYRKPSIGLLPGVWEKLDEERGKRSMADYLREVIEKRDKE